MNAAARVIGVIAVLFLAVATAADADGVCTVQLPAGQACRVDFSR